MAKWIKKEGSGPAKAWPRQTSEDASWAGNLAATAEDRANRRANSSRITPATLGIRNSVQALRNGENTNADNNQYYGGGGANTPYIEQLNSLYDQIMNRKPFQYDLNGDLLYRQMADQYTRLGQQAMRDTMGQAAALTGGYGNSYAQQVGNQAYQQYLTYLNEQIPSLYDRAYGVWQDEGDRLLEQYQLAAAHPGYLAAMMPSTGGGGGAAEDEEQTQTERAAYTAALGGMGLLPTPGTNGLVVVGDAANRLGWQPVGTTVPEATTTGGETRQTTTTVSNPMTQMQYPWLYRLTPPLP